MITTSLFFATSTASVNPVLSVVLISSSNGKAQVPIKNFDGKAFDVNQYSEFISKKNIP